MTKNDMKANQLIGNLFTLLALGMMIGGLVAKWQSPKVCFFAGLLILIGSVIISEV